MFHVQGVYVTAPAIPPKPFSARKTFGLVPFINLKELKDGNYFSLFFLPSLQRFNVNP